MKIAYAPLNLCLEMHEDCVTCLVLEQPKLFYEIVSDIYSQTQNSDGVIVFSAESVPVSLSKDSILLSQFIPFEMNWKQLLNALYARLKKESLSEDMFLRTHEISSQIDTYLNDLTHQCNGEFVWNHLEDITALMKAVSLRFYDGQENLSGQLLDFMIACEEYLRTRLFITVNLRSYLSQKETEALFHSSVLHKICLLCIESREYPQVQNERRIIVDKDFCLI